MDESLTRIQAILEMQARWNDQGMRPGMAEAQRNFDNLNRGIAAGTVAAQVNAQQTTGAFNTMVAGVRNYATQTNTYLRDVNARWMEHSAITRGVAQQMAGGAFAGGDMTRLLTTRIAGAFAFVGQARSLVRSLGELDLLQASYARIAGASEGAEAGVSLAGRAMQDATAIAYEYGASIKDVMGTMVELARLGRSTSEVRYLTQSLAELRLLLASGTGELMTMQKAMGTVVTMMNQFDASVFESIRGLRLMAEYDIRTATSFDQIQVALNRFAAAAKSANMTLTETIQVATAATETGIGGSRAGTMLNSVIARIGSNKDAIKMLKQLGVSAVTMRDGMLVAASSIDQVLEAWRKLPDSREARANFAQAFAGLRLQSPFMAFLNVYDKQTRLQVDDAGFKNYTDQLERDLHEAIDKAPPTVVVTPTATFDDADTRARLREGIDNMLAAMRRDFEGTSNINMKSLVSYVRNWFGISSGEARQIIDQYRDMFGEVQSLMSSYSQNVEAPYTIMARAIEDQTNSVRDQQKHIVETMQNTVEVAHARLRVAWESAFNQSNFLRLYRQVVEQATDTAIALGNTIMGTFNMAFGAIGFGSVQRGLRVVGGLIQMYFGARTARMMGDLFAGAVQELGLMATRTGQVVSAMTGLWRGGPMRDYFRDVNGFFNGIQNSFMNIRADMQNVNRQINNLGRIRVRNLFDTGDFSNITQRLRSTLISGYRGVDGRVTEGFQGSEAELTQAFRRLNGVLNSGRGGTPSLVLQAREGAVALGSLADAMDRFSNPAHGTMAPRALAEISRVMRPFTADVRGGQQALTDIGAASLRLGTTMDRMRPVMDQMRDLFTAPFAPDRVRAAAGEALAAMEHVNAQSRNVAAQSARIMGEIARGGTVAPEEAQRVVDNINEVERASREATVAGQRLTTTFNGALVTVGQVFTGIANIVGVVTTLTTAWRMFVGWIQTASNWISDMRAQVRQMRTELDVSDTLARDARDTLDGMSKGFESSTNALSALVGELTKITGNQYVIDLIVKAAMDNTDLTDGSGLSRSVVTILERLGPEMAKAMTDSEAEFDASKFVSPVDKIIEEIGKQTGGQLSDAKKKALHEAIIQAFTVANFNNSKWTSEVQTVAQQMAETFSKLADLETQIPQAQKSASDALNTGITMFQDSVLNYFGTGALLSGQTNQFLGEIWSETLAGLETSMDNSADAFRRALGELPNIWRERITQHLGDGKTLENATLQEVTRALSEYASAGMSMSGEGMAYQRYQQEIRAMFTSNAVLAESFRRVMGDGVDIATATALDFFTWQQKIVRLMRQGDGYMTLAAQTWFKELPKLSRSQGITASLSDYDPARLAEGSAAFGEAIKTVKDATNMLAESKQLKNFVMSLDTTMADFENARENRVKQLEVWQALIDRELVAIEREITAAGKDEQKLAAANKKKIDASERRAAIERKIADIANSEYNGLIAEKLDEVIIGLLDAETQKLLQTSGQLAEVQGLLTQGGKEFLNDLADLQRKNAEIAGLEGKAKEEAQKAADDLKTRLFKGLETLVGKIGDLVPELKTKIGTLFDSIVGGGLLDASKRAGLDAKAVASSGVITSATLAASAADTDALDKALKRVIDLENKVAEMEKQAARAGRTGGGSRRDPVRDLVAQLKSEHQERLALIELEFRGIKDAEGNIIEYLDRTDTIEFIEAKITENKVLLEGYNKALEKAKDPKIKAQIKKEIAQAQLETAKMNFEIKVKVNKEEVDELQHQLRMMEIGSSGVEQVGSSATIREHYKTLYDQQMAIYDKQMQVADPEEKRRLEMEKEVTAMEQQQKLAKLMADEFERAERAANRITAIDRFKSELTKFKGDWGLIGINDQMKGLGTSLDTATNKMGETMDNLTAKIKEARAGIEAEYEKAKSAAGDDKEALAKADATYKSQMAGIASQFSGSRDAIIESFQNEMKKAADSISIESITAGQKIFDPLTQQMINPTIANVEKWANDVQEWKKKKVEELAAKLREQGVEEGSTEWTEAMQKLDEAIDPVIEKVGQALMESLRKMYEAVHDALISGWEEGFNIGLEYGFTKEGFEALKKSIKTNIARQVSKAIQDMIAKHLTTAISDMFQNIFSGLPDVLGSSLAGIIGPMVGGIVGSLIGFLIGGLFSDFINEQAEAQLKQQRDSVSAQGFGWSYQEADQAEPYYQFQPDVTKESVNIINFRTTFNITTDAAQALMAQRRELERVCTEIFNSMTRAASSTFGPKSAV